MVRGDFMPDNLVPTVHDNYFFHASQGEIQFKVVIVTGACRSGKTLLAQLLGSMRNVEWIEEPWMPMMIPIMQAYGLMDPIVGRDVMRAITEELFYDRILLRGANFRPGDLSSIWKVKEATEIFERLVNLRSRDDVRQYALTNAPVLLYVLAETNPFIPFMYDTFPNCRIIQIIRNGLDVAVAIAEKQWYSEERLKAPLNNILYRAYYRRPQSEPYSMPWWIREGDEERFLGFSEFAKGLYYWHTLLDMNLPQLDEFKQVHADCYQEIRYEDLVQNPQNTLQALSDFLQVVPSERTMMIQSMIHTGELDKKTDYPLREVPKDELDKVRDLLDKLGYSTESNILRMDGER